MHRSKERCDIAKKNPAQFADLVMRTAQNNMFGMTNDGICLNCHETQSGCEPDAENYECENCGERDVFGAEQILIIGM